MLVILPICLQDSFKLLKKRNNNKKNHFIYFSFSSIQMSLYSLCELEPFPASDDYVLQDKATFKGILFNISLHTNKLQHNFPSTPVFVIARTEDSKTINIRPIADSEAKHHLIFPLSHFEMKYLFWILLKKIFLFIRRVLAENFYVLKTLWYYIRNNKSLW